VAIALGAAAPLVVLVGCQTQEVSQFPLGLEPVGANTAPRPTGTPHDPYPEVQSLVMGERDGVAFVHARAFVHAPIARVWDAFKVPEVVVDRRGITSFSVVHHVEEGFDVSFRTRYIIEDIVTVQFDVTWRQSAVEGTATVPLRVAMKYQKTWGSSFVRRMTGSIELLAETDEVTSIGWVQELDAVRTGPENVASWCRDMYASVLAHVRGEPLPTY
jgi:hypothetical protein